MTDETIQPFTIAVPGSDLDDLRDRLARVRWPDEHPGDGYGVPPDRVRRLNNRWRDGDDWREWEARLNAHPHPATANGAQNIHFLHVRSPEPGALPLILTRGWPGSSVNYLRALGPPADPRAHGSSPADACNLVLPPSPTSASPAPPRGWAGIGTGSRAWGGWR